MSFDWEDFLELAEYLSEEMYKAPLSELTPTKEADLRTAISRAYYAAFNNAQIFLDNKNDTTIETGKGVHERLISRFLNHPTRARQIMGDQLRRIMRKRVDADYHLVYTGSLYDDVDDTIETARKLLVKYQNVK